MHSNACAATLPPSTLRWAPRSTAARARSATSSRRWSVRWAAKRSAATAGRRADAASLYGLIYPDKHLQERLYSILPFLAKHGFDLIGQVYDHIELGCPDHRVLVI